MHNWKKLTKEETTNWFVKNDPERRPILDEKYYLWSVCLNCETIMCESQKDNSVKSLYSTDGRVIKHESCNEIIMHSVLK